MDIVEGNKLIAEFMGAEFDMCHYHVTDSYTKEDGEKVFKYQQGTAFYDVGKEPSTQKGGYPITILKYHTSWDWLMPVVEKIESVGHKTIIGGGDHWGNYCNIMFGRNADERRKIFQETNTETKAMGQHESKITSVWIAVVEFIEWYNQLKQ